jgi:hypothetical protein
MPRFLIPALAWLASLAVPSIVSAQQIDNPMYTSWARHTPGTSITMRSITEMRGKTIETTTAYTLRKVLPDRVVVEMVAVSDATGSKVKNPPQEMEIRRKFYLLPGVKPEDIGKPDGTIASGEETLTLAGKEFRAKWFDSKGQTEAGPSRTRTWMSDEVPGRLLKSVLEVPNVDKTTTLSLIEFQVP